MDIDLGPLGLTAIECEVYYALLDRTSATQPEIVETFLDVPPETTAEALRSLRAKGLLTGVAGTGGGPPGYAAISPAIAVENLASRREAEVQALRMHTATLAERWRRAGRATLPDDLIEVVVGREATVQRSEQIQRSATSEVLMITAPPYAGYGAGNPLEAEILARGEVGYRCLYDRAGLEEADDLQETLELVELGEQARVAAGLPVKLVMADASVAMMPLESSPTAITAAVVIHPSALLTSLLLMFEASWEKAQPLSEWVSAPGVDGPVGPTFNTLERQIIRLLRIGLTDVAIGRQLGIGERTVQRRVQGIMQAFGVHNRLQLGMRLADPTGR